MLQKANVLILDEPTNHLDLYSKEVLESALMDYEGTLLFISHDRYFLNKMAESMLDLQKDGLTSYLGNYDDYVEKKAELAEMETKRLAKEAEKKAGSVSAVLRKANLLAAAAMKRTRPRSEKSAAVSASWSS